MDVCEPDLLAFTDDWALSDQPPSGDLDVPAENPPRRLESVMVRPCGTSGSESQCSVLCDQCQMGNLRAGY